MLLIRGTAGGTTLTGTLYERGERPPSFRGAPDEDAPYVWVCDEFYEVDSGGGTQVIDDREVNVAFETTMPRGFETREQAVEAGGNTSGSSSPVWASGRTTSPSRPWKSPRLAPDPLPDRIAGLAAPIGDRRW